MRLHSPLHHSDQKRTPQHRNGHHHPCQLHSARTPGRSKRRLRLLRAKRNMQGLVYWFTLCTCPSWLLLPSLLFQNSVSHPLLEHPGPAAGPKLGLLWQCPPPCSWGGLLGMFGGSGRQAHGSSERAPPWADDTLDHWRYGPTSTEDSDFGLPEAGLCQRSPLVQQATLASTGNLLTSLNAVWVAAQWPLTHAGGLCARVTLSTSGSPCGGHRLMPWVFARAQH